VDSRINSGAFPPHNIYNLIGWHCQGKEQPTFVQSHQKSYSPLPVAFERAELASASAVALAAADWTADRAVASATAVASARAVGTGFAAEGWRGPKIFAEEAADWEVPADASVDFGLPVVVVAAFVEPAIE
jgi:hypothetical protein